MTEIRLYNTLTRQKDVLTPADKNRVTMYVCGPTVYNRAHIGNARPAVVFDVLFRLLRHTYGDNAVHYARNFTDIDDKIMAAAEAEGVPIETITKRYEDFYRADMGALGVLRPTYEPRATEHVQQMVAMIEALIEKGAAYAADGHALFDITKDAAYGTLSRRPMDEMIAGARVEVAPYKKSPGDFVLWKPSAAGQPGWDSPWGRGRPGWHIECSAMIEAHLDTTIDIHGGGLDLQFPHHENECAQSRCAHDGAPLAKVWMHNGFLSMDKEKMSKSLGNVVTVGELLEQGHKGETLRLALLMAHYRQPLDWNERLLEEARNKLNYFYGLLRDAKPVAERFDSAVNADRNGDRELHLGFELALLDDLNTPQAIGCLHEMAGFLANSLSANDSVTPDRAIREGGIYINRQNLLRAANILGLLEQDPDEWFTGGADARVEEQIAARTAAKAAKNWTEADRIRDQLKAEGILLEDKPDGTTVWRRA
ncbi:cysteine--tRNA ligase [Sphingosinicella sp.]|uniref:cysteine--tRNA ligase n=1 Tax=Sphingosinicella sp. TaxID=1917971 RepID=UPI0017FF78E3|nr:cysteine--tRNA ligase [Sphingosinicella sp.]MBA4756868.1 cysteine--tRNA ligase [Sphingosinicella sp.]